MYRLIGIICLLTTLTVFPTQVTAKLSTYTITPGPQSEVKFTSKAPLETIIGVTNQVSGSITLDPDDLSQPVSGNLEVHLGSLDTGNKIRDGHMRDNHLHTEKYPLASFNMMKIVGIPDKRLTDGDISELSITGDFTLHGITQRIDPEVEAIWNSEKNEIAVTARFTIKLADYGIPRPQFLVMKLGEEQKIDVKFTAKQQGVTE